jgi:hypothetical protein
MANPQLVRVYQFKVSLRGISPMIWRRLQLRTDHSIADLHYAIQIAMGWSDSHLHRFHIHGKDYGVEHEGGIPFDDNPDKIRLADFGFRIRERFLYEYDLYDNWEHDVRLEKVLSWNSAQIHPVCTGGQLVVPPEDSGGARVYMEEGDPRWREWLDATPRQEWAFIVDTVERVLDSADLTAVADREVLRDALNRVKAHRASRPDRIDRRAINERLRQYARGDREWLFCETIGG